MAYDLAMANHVPSLQSIRARKNELLSAAAKYDNLAVKARAEAADYEAAERVWLKMAPDSASENIPVAYSVGNYVGPSQTSAIAAMAYKKPSGVPPVPEMIIEALAEASEHGTPGLTPQGLLSFVKQKYWPEATNPDVGSTAWRMWKAGRLSKPDPESSLYSLPMAKSSLPDPLDETDQEMKSGVV
jgi:hypothetical protein